MEDDSVVEKASDRIPSKQNDLPLGSKLGRGDLKVADPVDILIVGGGPAGTAAAFRAVELGLSVLVIDRDEILSVLRDWMFPDDKSVSSSFGPGGRRVPFPVGEKLLEALVWDGCVPASELYNKWAQIYIDRGIPARAGLELVNLEEGGGFWTGVCIDQATRKEVRYRARTVLLAMGRGIPIRLDMPGDPTGIHYKLKGTQPFINAPCLVVGGGTTAAEAVIAISNAKVAAGDPSDVFWSYRKASLPRVNSTLADSFFQAYAHGNVKYLPYSFPLAVLKHHDGTEILALRSDRIEVPGRPPECKYIEFPKDRVVACIGADLPVQFLASLGIQMLTAVDSEEKFVAASPILESTRRNVYIIGDLLSPAYIQTTDFSPEAMQSTVIEHQGNFKQGMIDGTLIIEAVNLRLSGRPDREIARFLEEKLNQYKDVHRHRLEQLEKETPVVVPGTEPQKEAPVSPRLGAVLSLLTGQEPQEVPSREYFFGPGRYKIGHENGDITFPDDEGVVDDHVALIVEPEACYVSSEGMQHVNETWVDLRSERTVPINTLIAAGRQRIRITEMERGIFLAILGAGDQPRSYIPTFEEEKVYGRKATNAVMEIDSSDNLLSRRHFTFSARGSTLKLRDFGSLNHTFFKVMGAIRLNEGDILVVGSKRLLFKGIETGEGRPKERLAGRVPGPPEIRVPLVAVPGERSVPPPEAVLPFAGRVTASAKAPGILVSPLGKLLPIDRTKSLLDLFKERGWATKDRKQIGQECQSLYNCERADCGLCILRVLSGAETLSEMTGKEKRTLKSMVEAIVEERGSDLKLEECRLACQAKAGMDGACQIELLGDTEAGE